MKRYNVGRGWTVQLPICALFAWYAIILFALMPKRLSVLDLVFLYCVTVILTTATFTTFDVDLQFVTIPRSATSSFSTFMCRIVTIPALILMAVNALQPAGGKRPRWDLAVAIWIGLVLFDWTLNFLGVITYRRAFAGHALGASITYFAFIAIIWCLSRWFARFGRETAR